MFLDYQTDDIFDLSKLNRKERRLYNKVFKPGDSESMLVNLTQKIEAMDADGQLVKNKLNEAPSLREVILIALRQPLQIDHATGLKEKNERYLLIKKLSSGDEVELNEKEIKTILERVGKVHLQVEIVGRVMELLAISRG
jgi:hypothetical protein